MEKQVAQDSVSVTNLVFKSNVYVHWTRFSGGYDSTELTVGLDLKGIFQSKLFCVSKVVNKVPIHCLC